MEDGIPSTNLKVENGDAEFVLRGVELVRGLRKWKKSINFKTRLILTLML